MAKNAKIIAALGVAAGLGVAALPLGAFATEYVGTGTVDVELIVPDVISMTIDSTNIVDGTTEEGTGIDFGEVTAAHSDTQGTTTIVVNTNKPNGYTLTAAGTALTNAGGDTIGVLSTAGGSTVSDAAAADAANEGWGINVALTQTGTVHTLSGAANFAQDGKYYMSTSAAQIDNFTAGEIDQDSTYTYNITYGVNVAPNKPAGTYTGTATYVATGVAN